MYTDYKIKILSIQEPVKSNSSGGNYVCLTEIEVPIGTGRTNSYIFRFRKSEIMAIYNQINGEIVKNGCCEIDRSYCH